MRKTIYLFAAIMLCVSLLTGCGCNHEWMEADCDAAKTCALCQETEGEALGHSWKEADCESARICTVCSKTEGEALGHSWKEADCESARACTVCGKTEGEALEHDWQIVGCDLPQTCKACGITDENIVGHQFANFLPEYESWTMTGECAVCHETQTLMLEPMIVVYNVLADSKWNATVMAFSDGSMYEVPEEASSTISFDNNFGATWKVPAGPEVTGEWRFVSCDLRNGFYVYSIELDIDENTQTMLVMWSTSDPEGDGVLIYISVNFVDGVIDFMYFKA